MNDRAREVLTQAALRAQPQAFGAFQVDEAVCAMRLLTRAKGEAESVESAFGFSRDDVRCLECALAMPELPLLLHLNDAHRWDFLTLARKMP